MFLESFPLPPNHGEDLRALHQTLKKSKLMTEGKVFHLKGRTSRENREEKPQTESDELLHLYS